MKTPSEYATLLKSMKREWLWLWHYMLRYRLGILVYIVIGLAGTAMSLGTGLASKFLIDAVVSHNSGVLIKTQIGTVCAADLHLGTDDHGLDTLTFLDGTVRKSLLNGGTDDITNNSVLFLLAENSDHQQGLCP